MQTLYIDVYFLINFSVDFLSLYFATAIAKLPTSVARLLLGSGIGAAVAIANVFITSSWLGYLSLFCGFALMIAVSTRRVTFYRRVKMAFCFAVVEMLIGGLVYFLYGFLDRNLAAGNIGEAGGAQNRSLLLLAIVILISIGVFKALISIFSFRAGSETVLVEIELFGRTVSGEALVDTGNLVKDPIDLRSVMLIDRALAEELLGERAGELENVAEMGGELARRIRMIPISSGEGRLLVGFRPDSVSVSTEKGRQTVDVTVAIDKNEGGYGGARMLMPSAAIRDVI